MPSSQSPRLPLNFVKPPALHPAPHTGPAMPLNPSLAFHHQTTPSPSPNSTLTSTVMRPQPAPMNPYSRDLSSALIAASSNVSRSSQLITPNSALATTLSLFPSRATSQHQSRRLARPSTPPTLPPKSLPEYWATGLPSRFANPPSSLVSSKESYATAYSSACKRR